MTDERLGVVHLDGWAGHTCQACRIVGETPKRYRIQALESGRELRLPKGHGLVKILYPGTHLVPKSAVTFHD